MRLLYAKGCILDLFSGGIMDVSGLRCSHCWNEVAEEQNCEVRRHFGGVLKIRNGELDQAIHDP